MGVAVPGGEAAGAGHIAQAGHVDGKVFGEQGDAVGLGLRTQEDLAEIEVGDAAGEVETQPRVGEGGLREILLEQSAQLQTGFDGALAGFERRHRAVFVIEEFDLGAEIGFFLVEHEDFEAPPAGGDDIHPPVFVAFDDFVDGGGATDIENAFVAGEHDAELGLFLQHGGDHFLVAIFKNMKRERCAGEQHDLEREEGKPATSHATIMSFRTGPSRTMQIDGSVALITGGSEGIGAACARSFHRRGAKVALIARNREKLEATAAAVDGLALAGDLCDGDFRRRAVEQTLERYGRIDVLINNAGIGLYAPAWSAPLADVRAMMELNLFATLELTQLVAPGMRARRRGMIVNVSSIAGKVTLPWLTLYSASKHMLGSLTNGLRMELQPDNVQAMLVCPGYVSTRFQDHVLSGRPPEKIRNSQTFLITPERCAEDMARGVEKDKRTVVTPGGAWWFVLAARLLPATVDAQLARIYHSL